MENSLLSDLSNEQLVNKEKALKVQLGLFSVLVLALFFFIIRSYVVGDGIDWAILTIAICSVAGPVTLYPGLKEVQNEIQSRR